MGSDPMKNILMTLALAPVMAMAGEPAKAIDFPP